jgi:uncharacterized protein (DUF1330 family)
MSVFFLAGITKILDEKMYNEYIEKASTIVEKYGGEYIFKSNQIYPISGDWDLKRTILIRFDSKKHVQDCFQSTEYQRIAHLRENSTVSKAIMIEE